MSFLAWTEQVDYLRLPAAASAVGALGLPKGSRGLDAGCGMGSHTELLIEATSPGSFLTGLDISSENLRVAEESARRKGLSDRTLFRRGEVERLPFDPSSFDWAWSADCVGFIPGDPVALVRGLAEVVRPGGTVALLLWSSQQLLPGYPSLEARLNGTKAGIAPATPEGDPERHFLRSLGWLHKAGLLAPAAHTFVVDVHAPLDERGKNALAAIIEMRWGHPKTELPASDWALFRRLTDRRDPDCILDRGDYFGFFTYSLFWGRVPE